VLRAPAQSEPQRLGRVSTRSAPGMQQHRSFTLAVFVDMDRESPEVVSAYRTSKVAEVLEAPCESSMTPERTP